MEDLFDAIESAPEPQKTYFMQLFKDIPKSNSSCRLAEIKANTKFISANEPCHSLWILIEGRVRATEEQISGEVYVFTEFQAPELFGEMEGLAGISYFRVSLETVSDCKFIVLPMNSYLNWIQHDAEALFLRTRAILSRTLEETRDNHTYLFLDGLSRLILHFTQYYRKFATNDICIMQIKRQQIADATGFSTKTVNRSIKKLSENGLISVVGRKIIISNNQYQQLLDLVDKNLRN